LEALHSLVVNRVLLLDDAARGDVAPALIARLRTLVREARAARPELADYRLFDIGLRRRGGALLVSLYFHK